MPAFLWPGFSAEFAAQTQQDIAASVQVESAPGALEEIMVDFVLVMVTMALLAVSLLYILGLDRLQPRDS